MGNTDCGEDTNEGFGWAVRRIVCEYCGDDSTHVWPWGLIELECGSCGKMILVPVEEED